MYRSVTLTVTGSMTQELTARELLRRVDIDIEDGDVIVIYGPPAVGKSLFAALLAKSLGRETVVFAAEPNYGTNKYRSFIMKYFPRETTIYDVWKWREKVRYVRLNLKRMDKQAVIIIDSISAMIDLLADDEDLVNPRTISGQLSPLARMITARLKVTCLSTGSVGVVIAQATNTAGVDKYRGIMEFKPAFTTKVDHYISYEVFMAKERRGSEYNTLTVTIHRTNSSAEGKKVCFNIVGDKIVEVKEN